MFACTQFNRDYAIPDKVAKAYTETGSKQAMYPYAYYNITTFQFHSCLSSGFRIDRGVFWYCTSVSNINLNYCCRHSERTDATANVVVATRRQRWCAAGRCRRWPSGTCAESSASARSYGHAALRSSSSLQATALPAAALCLPATKPSSVSSLLWIVSPASTTPSATLSTA